MAGEKRQRNGGGGGGGRSEDRSAKRRRYAAAAGKSKAKPSGAGEIRGPGLWLSCARRKEAISTSEAYDLLNDVGGRFNCIDDRCEGERENSKELMNIILKLLYRYRSQTGYILVHRQRRIKLLLKEAARI